MKKIRIVQIIGIILFIIYLILFLLDLIWGILDNLDIVIFSIILVLISISLLSKGVLLKSSSTLWFSIVLVISAILILILSLLHIDISARYYLFSFVPIVASIMNILVFKYMFYIKIIILNISIIIPLLIYQFIDFVWWINILIAIASLTLGIIICRSINLNKEKV